MQMPKTGFLVMWLISLYDMNSLLFWNIGRVVFSFFFVLNPNNPQDPITMIPIELHFWEGQPPTELHFHKRQPPTGLKNNQPPPTPQKDSALPSKTPIFFFSSGTALTGNYRQDAIHDNIMFTFAIISTFKVIKSHYTPRKLCLWRVYCFHVVRPSIHPCVRDVLVFL